MTPNAKRPDYRLLGALEIRGPGAARTLGPSASAVLAALLVRAPQPVPAARLQAELWPGRTVKPAALRQRVKELRHVLGADEIRTTGGGYAMPDAAERTDTYLFQEFRARAAEAHADSDLETARELLRDALRLWTGDPALAGLHGYEFAARFARDWDERRAAAVLELLDVLTGLGRHNELAELLHREQDIIPERIAGWRAAHPAPRHAGEPVRVVGRGDIIGRLGGLATAAWADDGPGTRVIRVSGPAGVGITTVLGLVADRLAAEGAQVCQVDMRGEVDEQETVTHAQNALITALGVTPDAMPAELAEKDQVLGDLLMRLSRQDRFVVILDHVSSADQVAALTRRDAFWTVIVASRPDLPEVRPGLAVPVEVPPLDEKSAVEMLRIVLGRPAVDQDQAATLRLVELCERLPFFLALAIAAIVRTGETVRSCADTIDRRRRELRSQAGYGVFEYSRRDLPGPQQELLALTGRMQAVSVTVDRAAAMLGTTPVEAGTILAGLDRARLIVAGGGRYLFRPLVLAYAAHLPAERWPAAQRLLLEDMLTEVRRVAGPIGPGEPGAGPALRVSAWDWYRAEGPNLRGAVTGAVRAELDELCWRLVEVAGPVLYLTGAVDDWGHLVHAAGIAAERLGDPAARAHVLMTRAERERYLGEWAAAYHRYNEAVELSEGDDSTHAVALDGRADLAVGMYLMDDDPDWLARGHDDARESHRLFTAAGNVQGAASALSGLAEVLAVSGRNEEAVPVASETLRLYRSVPDPVNEAVALRILGSIQARLGRLAEAAALLGAAVEVDDREHTALEGARALARLGEVQLRQAHHDQARMSLSRALLVLRTGPDLRWRAVATMLSGRLSLATGDHTGAVRSLNEAGALFRRLGDHHAADQCESLLDDGSEGRGVQGAEEDDGPVEVR
ncbi:BTAD domain-containing putative transcriptional regulator [Winogradskya consettensis]|uniref:SARP family transcriptional regulator n=1 Tax=Winogradskya consettensis TaxID=113560 RepID=A0A919SN74_9ACTN|nr:tetratricopeptide repeat protein [Actinoplanes consettensis]GIM75256.1 SARP family transcriptional regulator [Actinoplanes consettensis]